MIDKIKEMIKQNEEIAEVLYDCSDDFILENATLILSALDPDSVKPGYKIKLVVDEEEGTLNWTYVAHGEESEKQAKIDFVKMHYAIELHDNSDNDYLVDLDDLRWTEGRRILASEFKRIIDGISSGESLTKGIWMMGPSNAGKTFASIGLLNKFANKHKSVAFVNVSDLILVTQNSFNAALGDRNHETYVDKARKVEVLVIDDIGTERPTPWFKENILLPIIDYRFRSGKTTVFTSNLTIEKYANRLKGRSQNPETEEDTNNKIIARINSLIEREVEVKV